MKRQDDEFRAQGYPCGSAAGGHTTPAAVGSVNLLAEPATAPRLPDAPGVGGVHSNDQEATRIPIRVVSRRAIAALVASFNRSAIHG